MINRRKQFPMVLAYATTVHKAQGLTLDTVIVDFKRKSRRVAPAGAFYTSATRVRCLENLFLRNFEESHIRTDSRVKEEMERLKDKQHKFLKRFLNQPCFENSDSESKISYLNINGLTSHQEDISMDRNLINSDVICIAETKSKERQQSLDIPGFDCIAVLEPANENSGGMILLCKQEIKHSLKVIEKQHIQFGSQSCYLEYIKMFFKDEEYSFVYFHPTFASKGLQWIKEKLHMFSDSSGN